MQTTDYLMKLIDDPNGKISENNQKLNSSNNLKLNFENFLESNLKISEIESKENDTKKFESISSINNLDNVNNNIQTKNNEINDRKNKKRLTKEDLNSIPLPIFSCIYCSNEKIAFNHLINEYISNKYLFQTSIYDMKVLENLIKRNPIVDHLKKNPPLLDIIIKNTEFISHYYNKTELKEILKTQKMKKIYESNFIKTKRIIMHKLENKLIRKRNKEFNIIKSNSNKIYPYNENKPSFQKPNNSNSTFINDNITSNKNSTTNTNCASSSPNRGLSLSLNNNINENLNTNNNNIYIGFNHNNNMQSIMEKIEVNEESECESEEKFLDILDNQINLKRKINKNNISFENNFYDIWNPEITEINEKEEDDEQNLKIKNYLSQISNKGNKRLLKINFDMKKLYKFNFNHNIKYYRNKNKENCNIINYNSDNENTYKIKNNIFIPLIRNKIKKGNLIEFINENKRKKFSIESASVKSHFSQRDINYRNINSKHYVYLLNSLLTTRDLEKYNNILSSQGQNGLTKLQNLLKPKSSNYKNSIINKRNSNKLIIKPTLSLISNSSINKKNNLTSVNFLESKISSMKRKSISMNNDLTSKKNYNINLHVDLNNKKINKLNNYIKIPLSNTRFNSTNGFQSKKPKRLLVGKEIDVFTSLPNLKFNLSPINRLNQNEKNMNPYQKKILFENNLRKINSYKFFQKNIFQYQGLQ